MMYKSPWIETEPHFHQHYLTRVRIVWLETFRLFLPHFWVLWYLNVTSVATDCPTWTAAPPVFTSAETTEAAQSTKGNREFFGSRQTTASHGQHAMRFHDTDSALRQFVLPSWSPIFFLILLNQWLISQSFMAFAVSAGLPCKWDKVKVSPSINASAQRGKSLQVLAL